MKIRTRLIVALLLLSVVPLTGIVLYGHITSLRAAREATEAEADRMARDLQGRLEETRRDLKISFDRVAPRLLDSLWFAEQAQPTEVARVLAGLGDDAELIRTVRIEPLAPAAPTPDPMGIEAAPDAGSPPGAPAPPAVPKRTVTSYLIEQGDGYVLDLPSLARDAEQPVRDALADAPEAVRSGVRVVERFLGMDLGDMMVAGAAAVSDDELTIDFDPETQAFLDGLRRRFREEGRWREAERQRQRTEGAELRDAEQESRELRDAEILRARARRAEARRAARMDRASSPLPFAVVAPVERDGQLIGRLTPEFDGRLVLRRLMKRLDGDHDAVPFALDDEGNLYVGDDADRPQLESLDLLAHLEPVEGGEDDTAHPLAAIARSVASDREPERDRMVLGDWVVVTSEDPGTGLRLGIASPMSDALSSLRVTSMRNFGAGLGLIAVALLGILPLSRRLTRDLEHVTAGARRIAGGDLDARVGVHSNDEIGELASAFNRMAVDLGDNQRRLIDQEVLEVELARKNDELEEARRFQLSMLPTTLPEIPGLRLAVSMRTATEVGGDYYDFRHAEDGTLTLAIGDATGHGATAGRMVTVVKSLFSSDAGDGPLTAFLAGAHRTVKRMRLGRMAMALTVARIADGRLRLAAAGMPPVLVRKATGEVVELAMPGMPLGGLDYTYEECSVALDAGDTVLLMTDGFPELPNAEGEPLGYSEASKLLARAGGGEPDDVVDALSLALEAWTDGKPPADDVTFVVLKVDRVG